MTGFGYRKRYTKVIKQGVEGHYPSANKALTLRHGEKRQEASVPWVAGCICFEAVARQPHPFTGSGAPPRGKALRVQFSGVVSAEPFNEMGGKAAHPCADCSKKILV
ncbi:MAG: hypothetical protein APF77_06755 [Clostridia bacterium BRH_c25]|nr:MAG: hypothetical protein APF77_06755 [Clostridia bacterium BRH_c25]